MEVNESSFGPQRIRGTRGRGTGGTTIVFGVFNRYGQVITDIVPDCRKATLQAVSRGNVSPDSIIQTAGWSITGAMISPIRARISTGKCLLT